jgi:hypothetical protein
MLEYLKELLTAMNIPVTDFNLGYFFALVVVGFTLLGLFLIRVILKIVFRKKRCNSISIKSGNGDAFISSTAIMSVIKALEKEFKSLTINKVNLYRYRNSPFLEVYLDFDASKGGLPSHADKFKKRVIESLDTLFGIKNIRKVHLFLRHIQLHDLDILKTEKVSLNLPKTTEISVGKPDLKKDTSEGKEIPVKTGDESKGEKEKK